MVIKYIKFHSFYFLSCLLLLLWACTSSNLGDEPNVVNTNMESSSGNFNVIDCEGVKNQEVKSIHIDSNGDIYLGGETDFSSNVPVILKSSDFGSNWIEVYSGDSGVVDFINSNGDFRYATCYHSENRAYRSELLISQNVQGDWGKVEVDRGVIMGVHFVDSLKCLVVTKNRNTVNVYKSLDKGVNLKELTPPNYYFLYDNLVSSDSHIYGFYYPDFRQDSLGVFSLDILTGEYTTNILRSYIGIEKKKLEIIDENIVITLFLDSVIIRYQLLEDLSFKEISNYKSTLDYHYVDAFFNGSSGNVLFVLNNREESEHFNTYYLGVSADYGNTVDIIEESKSNYLKPYAYFDNKFIGYLRKGAFMIYEM